MKQSDSIAKISPDLVVALAEIEGAAKSAVNPHFRSKYANLEAVVDGSRDILAKHHCAVMQGAGHVNDGKLHVTTRVLHKSGEWIEEEFSIPLAKSDPQATLAALTYARRGALMSMLGMPAVEDDGETAMGRGAPPAKPTSAYQAKKDGLGPRVDELLHELRDTDSQVAVGKWISQHETEIAAWPENWKKIAREEIQEHRRRLSEAEMDDGFRGAVGTRSAMPAGLAGGNGAVAA